MLSIIASVVECFLTNNLTDLYMKVTDKVLKRIGSKFRIDIVFDTCMPLSFCVNTRLPYVICRNLQRLRWCVNSVSGLTPGVLFSVIYLSYYMCWAASADGMTPVLLFSLSFSLCLMRDWLRTYCFDLSIFLSANYNLGSYLLVHYVNISSVYSLC